MNIEKFSGRNFFSVLEKAAIKNDLSITGLAEKLGYPASTFMRWRDGEVNPRYETIVDIADAAANVGISLEI